MRNFFGTLHAENSRPPRPLVPITIAVLEHTQHFFTTS